MSIAVTVPLTPTNATDAAFRLWGSEISARLAAAGWIQTADTGQINWATVLTPNPTANLAMGYEIWRMNDALQATAPVFMKIEYGSGASATNPAIWVTIGSGSTGTGVLTGLVSTRFTINGASTTVLPCYFSGDVNRFSMIMFAGGSAGQCWLLSISRTTDVNGDDTDEGVLIFSKLASTVNQQYWNHDIGPAGLELSSAGALIPTGVFTSGVSGNKLSVYPIYLTKQGGSFFEMPCRDVIAYFNADIVTGSPVRLIHQGAMRTYMPGGAGSVTMCRSVTMAMMIRYE